MSVVPGFRYCPRLTVRMPRRPANGARTILRSICALSAAKSAPEVLSARRRCRAAPWTLASRATSARERSRGARRGPCALRPRRAARARRWCRARPAPGRRCTSCPDSKWMAVTTPGDSLLTATPRTAATVPTAEMVPSHDSSVATAVPTTSGGGPIFSPISLAWRSVWICLNLTVPRPKTMATTTTMGTR